MDDVYLRILSLERAAATLRRRWLNVDAVQRAFQSNARAAVMSINPPSSSGDGSQDNTNGNQTPPSTTPPPVTTPPPSGTPAQPPPPPPPPPGQPPSPTPPPVSGVPVNVPPGTTIQPGECRDVGGVQVCNGTGTPIVGGQGPGGSGTPISISPGTDGNWHVYPPPAGVKQIIPGLNPWVTPSFGIGPYQCMRLFPDGTALYGTFMYNALTGDTGGVPPGAIVDGHMNGIVICNPWSYYIDANTIFVLRMSPLGVLEIIGADCSQHSNFTGPCVQPGTAGVVTPDTQLGTLCGQCSDGFTSVAVIDGKYGTCTLKWDNANTRWIGNNFLNVVGSSSGGRLLPYSTFKTGDGGCSGCSPTRTINTLCTYVLTCSGTTLTLTGYYPVCTSSYGACTGALAPSGGNYAFSGSFGTTGASTVGTVALGTLADGYNTRMIADFGHAELTTSASPWGPANASCDGCSDPFNGVNVTLELIAMTGGCGGFVPGANFCAGQCLNITPPLKLVDSVHGTALLTWNGTVWVGSHAGWTYTQFCSISLGVNYIGFLVDDGTGPYSTDEVDVTTINCSAINFSVNIFFPYTATLTISPQ